MNDDARRERIEDEASTWAARLEGGGMTDADRTALAAWLDADPEHRWVLARYRQLSAAVEQQFQRPAKPRRRLARVVAFGLAAAAALAVLLAYTGRARPIETMRAERHLTTLADGSRIELNASSAVVPAFGHGERRVRFLHGEACFSVAVDLARPFVVETSAGTVRVTGTVFNVRGLTGGGCEVTVLEGNVHVLPAGAPDADTALRPGVQARIDSGRVAVVSLGEEQARNVASWREGRVIFADTPLREAMDRFAPYHSGRITVDPAVADLRLGGRYSLDDFDGICRAVEQVLPARVLRGPDGAVRIVPAAGPVVESR